ncbi:MAG: hypothetical protein M3285_10510 [Actinomycetota bacterium]|nr:hypothetical protein [Actinomycetota bacterium]
MSMRLVVNGVALSLFFLAACGSAERQTKVGGDASPGSSSVLYTCGDTAFDPKLLEGPGDLEDSEGALGDALRMLLKTPDGAMDGEGWRIVDQSGDEVLIAAPSPNDRHPYVSAVFERSGDEWKPVGWGDCLPMAVIGDRSPATWKLAAQPGDDTTELQLLVEERACSSGRALTEKNTRADIRYAKDEIVIIVSADSLSTGKNRTYTCIGNSPWPITVQLQEPVQGRRLIDGGSYPPAERNN